MYDRNVDEAQSNSPATLSLVQLDARYVGLLVARLVTVWQLVENCHCHFVGGFTVVCLESMVKLLQDLWWWHHVAHTHCDLSRFTSRYMWSIEGKCRLQQRSLPRRLCDIILVQVCDAF